VIALAWLASPGGRVVAGSIAAAILLFGLYWNIRSSIRDSIVVEQMVKEQEKLNDALSAEDRVRRQSSDPASLLKNDGHRRD
jgi:hypothetical protein